MRVAIMIHGAGGGAWEWNVWRTEFELQGWKVITPELMPSQKGLLETHFSDYLEQVLSLQPIANTEEFALIGASLGGILALVAHDRLKPGALVLVNSVPPKNVGRMPERIYPPILLWKGKGWEESRVEMPDCDESTQRVAASRWRDESGAVLNAVSEGIESPRPQCPVLVVAGEEDADVDASIARDIARWANADLHIHSGASHVGPILNPEAPEVARKVLVWLDGL